MAKHSIQLGAAVIGLWGYMAGAAEVRGTVSIDQKGLFEVDGGAPSYPISIALIPDQGQQVAHRPAGVQQVEFFENRMSPAFLTVQKGDRVEFINRDAVFHELFSLSPGDPVSLKLGKAGGQVKSSVSIVFDATGTTHFFCRIHNKSYARIDTVDSPYLKMVQPGEAFHFSGLEPGRWKLRLASPAAETAWVSVTALTTPPPLHLSLSSRSGGRGPIKVKTQSGVAQLYQKNAD